MPSVLREEEFSPIVLRDGMRLVRLGTAAGALGAIGAFRVLQTLFAGLQPGDLRSALGAAALLLALMLAAAALPARRAAHLNPVDALRSD